MTSIVASSLVSPSIIFVTSLKPMRPDFDQFVTEHTNAINSWKRLNCNKKIVVAGSELKEDGTKEFCNKHELIHEIPDCQYGLPIVRSIIECGQKHANDNDFVIYINADIVLDNRFIEFLELVLTTFPNLFDSEFYITSKRQNIEDFSLIDFNDSEWMDKLINQSTYDAGSAIDIVIHRKGSFIDTMVDFLIGRCAFDTWLNITGCSFPISINATGAFPMIHQFGKYYNSSGIIERKDIFKEELMSEEEKESWNHNRFLWNKVNPYKNYNIEDCKYIYRNNSIILK